MVGGSTRSFELNNSDYWLSAAPSTFAARDVLAPVAANLAIGIPLDKLGTEIDPITLRPGVLPLPQIGEDHVLAEVLFADRFGNAQLNIGVSEIESWGDRIEVTFGASMLDPSAAKTRVARLVTAFDDLQPSELGLIVDSAGLLSLCAARLGADQLLGIGSGAGVTLRPAK
jgi:S-adenosylmethionine hydrolase